MWPSWLVFSRVWDKREEPSGSSCSGPPAQIRVWKRRKRETQKINDKKPKGRDRFSRAAKADTGRKRRQTRGWSLDPALHWVSTATLAAAPATSWDGSSLTVCWGLPRELAADKKLTHHLQVRGFHFLVDWSSEADRHSSAGQPTT